MNPFLLLKQKNKLKETPALTNFSNNAKGGPNVINNGALGAIGAIGAKETLKKINTSQNTDETISILTSVGSVLPLVPVSKPLFLDNIYQKVDSYFQQPTEKVLILEGPCGCGKTHLLDYYAYKHDSMILMYDDTLEFDEFLNNANLNGRKCILVIDYIESLDLTIIHRHLNQLLAKHVIITTLNVYDSNVYKWKNKIQIVRMKTYTPKELSTILNTTNKALIDQCRGDVRFGHTLQRYTFDAAQDTFYDLFGTVKNGILHSNVSGIQSKDLYMFMYLLQQNSASWSLNHVKTLDAFCNIDLQERELPSENLCDYVNNVLEATSCKKVNQLQMPIIPNSLKMERCLRLAIPGTSDRLSQHDTLNCIRHHIGPRLTSTSEYYHENVDVRNLLKNSPFK